jgi:sarcosine oxidase subunit beta
MSEPMDTSGPHDVAVIGAGVMGATTALHLSRAGMRVALLDRGPICREASGVNAGTLTLHMTRAALIPYAIRGRALWLDAARWLGRDVGATATPGLCLAFTPEEESLLHLRAEARRAQGAPIEIIGPERARQIEPGLPEGGAGGPRAAAHCALDGHVTAYLTGKVYRAALIEAGARVHEAWPVSGVDRDGGDFVVRGDDGRVLRARRLVLAGGVWLERMLAWLGLTVPVKCLINQLVVTERMRPVMRSVVSIANGLLSLKQFANGTVLIGGGWQGLGNPDIGGVEAVPQNLIGNVRLARHAIPALAETRITRIWLGLESETADAMPMIGAIQGVPDAYVIGCVHSGYTSGPFMGKLLADRILEREPELPLFDPARLFPSPQASAGRHAA